MFVPMPIKMDVNSVFTDVLGLLHPLSHKSVLIVSGLKGIKAPPLYKRCFIIQSSHNFTMASQIAHIVYAQKYFDAYAPKFNPGEFLLGSIFPDIRRIAPQLKRRDTHMILETLNLDLEYLDSFHAGWKFHLYCDMRREEVLNRAGFYEIEGAGDHDGLAAKLLEDELVYGQYAKWAELAKFLNKVPRIETGINVSRETFELWYAMIAKYVEQKPDNLTRSAFVAKQPSLTDRGAEIIAAVDKIRKSDRVVKLLADVPEKMINGQQ